jgi:hypothetical protein
MLSCSTTVPTYITHGPHRQPALDRIRARPAILAPRERDHVRLAVPQLLLVRCFAHLQPLEPAIGVIDVGEVEG